MRSLLKYVLTSIRSWVPAQLLVFNASALALAFLLLWQRHALQVELEDLTVPDGVFDPQIALEMSERGVPNESIQQLIDNEAQAFVNAVNQTWRLQESVLHREYLLVAVVVIALAVDWIWAGRRTTAES